MYLNKLRIEEQRSYPGSPVGQTAAFKLLSSYLRSFFLNPLLQVSRNTPGTKQGTNEDSSQSDLHPIAIIFQSQTTRNSGPEDDYDMVTGVQEEITYYSPGTSWSKQKKTRSASQPPFLHENNLATIEADQVLLAIQQLAKNTNSGKFTCNILQVSKLPMSLTTAMPTLDGRSEKFEVFGYFFQTSLKIHNRLTEDEKINHFRALKRGDAYQTFKNINSPTRKNLGKILPSFRS